MPNWDEAEKHLNDIRQIYTGIGMSGVPALRMTIDPLFVRFSTGERTQELYDEIMNLE